MATKVLGVRVPEDLAVWAKAYAETRAVPVQAVLEEALRSFKVECESGVPEIRARVREQSSVRAARERGVGECSKREDGGGHVWAHPRFDALRSCIYCGLHGREPAAKDSAEPGKDEGGGHFARSGASRTELFSRLPAPMQSGTGDPKKAWPQGVPPAMAARAAEIVEAKKRRDRGEA